VVVFSASLSIIVVTAAYRVLSLKNKYLEEELEQLKADNHMESIAKHSETYSEHSKNSFWLGLMNR